MSRIRNVGLVAAVCLMPGALVAQTPAHGGTELWQGTMTTPHGEVTMSVEVRTGDDGASATVWLGDQKPDADEGQAAGELTMDGETMSFTLSLTAQVPGGAAPTTMTVFFKGNLGQRGLGGSYSIPDAGPHGSTGEWFVRRVEAWGA